MSHRRLLIGLIVILSALVALPITHTAVRANEESLAERVAALEAYRQQQRDWNSQLQGGYDARLKDLDKQVEALESGFGILRAFGVVGAFIVSVGAPFAWSAFSRRQRQAERAHRKFRRIIRALGYDPDKLEADEPEESEEE